MSSALPPANAPFSTEIMGKGKANPIYADPVFLLGMGFVILLAAFLAVAGDIEDALPILAAVFIGIKARCQAPLPPGSSHRP